MNRDFRSGSMPGWYAAIVLGLFFLCPFAIMLNFSFYHKITGGLYEPAFVFENYARLISPFFGRILLVSAGLCALASLIAVSFGFALTYSISNMSRKGMTFWLVLLVSLLSLSEVVTGFAWSTLYSRTAGLGGWLHELGIADAPRALSPGFMALLTALTFICIPFVVLVLFPSLARLPRDWTEAARTMGATPMRAVATVVIPSVRPAIVAAFILSFIYSLGSYVLPIMLGRPRHWTLSVHITDQALYQSNFPFAAALSVFLMVASLLLIAFVYRLQKRFS